MTEENQKRRQFLVDIEGIVRETLASQPMEDDPVRCGMTLDRGLVRVEEVVRKYKAEWPEHWQKDRPSVASRCTPSQTTSGTADRPSVAPRCTPSWMMSGRHG